ncbi:DUF6053 domain-containing protein [Lysobacter enzymogenes]|uniref:DUF6053 domain-containing protein n=1 Tax=Lysobacter enzymogenes TaxID=69 RepID=UPI003D18B5C9
MGGASAPRLLCQIAATGAESIGAEAPPPTAAGRIPDQPAPSRSAGLHCENGRVASARL